MTTLIREPSQLAALLPPSFTEALAAPAAMAAAWLALGGEALVSFQDAAAPVVELVMPAVATALEAARPILAQIGALANVAVGGAVPVSVFIGALGAGVTTWIVVERLFATMWRVAKVSVAIAAVVTVVRQNLATGMRKRKQKRLRNRVPAVQGKL